MTAVRAAQAKVVEMCGIKEKGEGSFLPLHPWQLHLVTPSSWHFWSALQTEYTVMTKRVLAELVAVVVLVVMARINGREGVVVYGHQL